MRQEIRSNVPDRTYDKSLPYQEQIAYKIIYEYTRTMTILLLCGSVAQKAHTRAFLRYIEGELKKRGVKTVFWDLLEKPMPIALPQYHADPLKTPDKVVQEFVHTVRAADGIVLGTPLYHGSYSGVLKNALDSLAYDDFRDKPVALVANGANSRATMALALEHLRMVVRALRGYTIQSQVGTHKDDYREDPEGYILISQDIKDRCELLVDELVTLVKLFAKHEVVQD